MNEAERVETRSYTTPAPSAHPDHLTKEVFCHDLVCRLRAPRLFTYNTFILYAEFKRIGTKPSSR